MVSAVISAFPVTLLRLYKAMDAGALIMFQALQPQTATVTNNALDIRGIYAAVMGFTDI